ncbi:hypothetical protein [Alishewanella sp. HL-SH05]|uniref:hypothetical protein n=1 Tax=Alishewanella sp. HL-SH05 TaxID=3461145 RepID=UPI004041F9EF
MRHLVFIIFSLLLSVPSYSSPRIPKTFQGTWDANDEACKTQYSDMRLHISSSVVEYWESSGNLIEVIESKNISFIARFAFSGEGENWESKITYFLLNEGSKLVQAFDDGLRVSRVRCTNA